MTPASPRPPLPPSPTPAAARRRRARLDTLLDPVLLRALAEPARALLLSCLLKCARPCSVTEVARCCDLDFSTVARHLGALARAGVLEARKQGRVVWYSPRSAFLARHFRDLADAIDELGVPALAPAPDAPPCGPCCGTSCGETRPGSPAVPAARPPASPRSPSR